MEGACQPVQCAVLQHGMLVHLYGTDRLEAKEYSGYAAGPTSPSQLLVLLETDVEEDDW